MDDAIANDKLLSARVRVIQLIAGALLVGVLLFLGVVLFFVGQGQVQVRPDPPLLSYMSLGFLATVLAMWFFLPGQIARHQVIKIAKGTWTPTQSSTCAGFPTDAHKLLAVFQTTSLVGWALLEGAGFMGCVAHMLEAQMFVLVVVGVAVLLMLLTFPTRGCINRWLEIQRSRIEENRPFAPQ